MKNIMYRKKIPVGILGATGMIGQRFVTLLSNHPWFEVAVLAASPRSAGRTYEEAVKGKWRISEKIPSYVKKQKVLAVEQDIGHIAKKVRLVFSALEMDKEAIKTLEIAYAEKGVAVVSNNSAHRWTEDVPMIMPEINPDHIELIHTQQKNRSWDTGLIAVKSNCSLQSYVPVLKALEAFDPQEVEVTTLQAISGAGKTFVSWPQMLDNCIPYIEGEEGKSEREPLKILGEFVKGNIQLAAKPKISATCIRVAVGDGHMASVAVKFRKKPTLKQILSSITHYKNPISTLHLPSSPSKFIQYFEDETRPQAKLDRNLGGGMTISCGRFREDPLFDWKFVCLSHNTIRGAAGGAILTAELLQKKNLL